MMYSGWMIQEYEYEIPARKFDDHELRIAIQIDKNLLYESFLKIVQYNNDHYRFKNWEVAELHQFICTIYYSIFLCLFYYFDLGTVKLKVKQKKPKQINF